MLKALISKRAKVFISFNIKISAAFSEIVSNEVLNASLNIVCNFRADKIVW